MKRMTKICTLLLALLLTFSLLATVILADDAGDAGAGDDGAGATTCVGTERNIASEAKITTTAVCWVHKDFLDRLVDGDKTEGVGSSHAERYITDYFTFDESYDFTRIVFTIQSEGKISDDRNLGNAVSNVNQDFEFTVKLFEKGSSGEDIEVFNTTYQTKDQVEVVVYPELINPVYKMEIFWEPAWINTHGCFWEIEMFTADGHEWIAPETPTVASTCVKQGVATLECANCEATKVSVIPALDHYNEDPCANTCGTCSTAITPRHVYTNACDGECDAEGCTGTRTPPHRAPDDIPCAAICADCGAEKAVDAKHTFEHKCSTGCMLCGATELREETHTWSNDSNTDPCGTLCGWDWCDEPKPHKYAEETSCKQNCLNCGTNPRESLVAHTYGATEDEPTMRDVCDAVCNVCEETRIAPHKHAYVCKLLCDYCYAPNENAAKLHVYSHDCDPDCNNEGCSVKRTTSHKYTSACDATCNVENCGHTRTVDDDSAYVPNHAFTSGCDNVCDVEGCGFWREVPPHQYTSNCDNSCNVEGCGHIRTVSDDPTFVQNHRYTSDCDAVCDVENCGHQRTVSKHVYDNNCDATCNVANCGYTRTPETDPDDEFYTAHRFVEEGQTDGGWIQIVAASKKTDGLKMRMCLECEYEEEQVIPALGGESEGLGTGAVVGIVAGSTAVAGTGGFSLFWFVIKKKSWADLIGVFKK